ncbi:caffeoylshikimate esterase [Daucus carota subsp. sativus]|nr:PREDICTED: caffeoylshikimate esterase-like [Daucus carota subsp. sativus]
MEAGAESVRYEEEYITNSRNMKLFTCRWLPSSEPKGLIFLCHGYGMECSIFMKDTGIRLAKAGYAVHGIDYEGHGKSSGLQGYIKDFDALVTDCSEHFTGICERKENSKKLRFIMGESMGGAVVLLLHRKKPAFWDGAILLAPMCKIADDVKPNQFVISALTKLTRIIPTWKIIPTPDIVDLAFREPAVRKEVRDSPYCYKGRPRLQTAYQLLTISLDIEKRLQEVSLPFLLLHGGDDKVTDPSVSKLLHEKAISSDKTFKLYPGMWHSLSRGETAENTEIVFSDITKWLDEKTATGNAKLERELKSGNDALHTDSSGKTILVE